MIAGGFPLDDAEDLVTGTPLAARLTAGANRRVACRRTRADGPSRGRFRRPSTSGTCGAVLIRFGPRRDDGLLVRVSRGSASCCRIWVLGNNGTKLCGMHLHLETKTSSHERHDVW